MQTDHGQLRGARGGADARATGIIGLRNMWAMHKPIRGVAIGLVDGYTSAIVFGSIRVEES